MSTMTPAAVRADLERAISASGANLATASRALKHNHAYLQQFVRIGKPAYLNERDRELLSILYGVDPEPLKPPAKELAGDVGKLPTGGAGDAPRAGDPIKDAREATVVHTWRQLSHEDQNAIIGMINMALRARGLPPIAI